MDHFKELSCTLGHAAGGRALQIFVREMDPLARLGGDEFVALMPHTDSAGAFTTVQRLGESAELATRSCLPDAQSRRRRP